MDQELLVGVLLIIVGLAIGLIAVALVLNRRAAREEQPVEAPVPPEAAEGSQAELEIPAVTPSEAAPAAVIVPEVPEPKAAVIVPNVPEPRPAVTVPQQPKPATASSAQRQLVAEIYRDQSSGILILRSGDKEYRTFSQIEDEIFRSELSALASDPATWTGEGPRAAVKPSEPRPAARPGSRSMLEGINSILQRALAEAGNQAKGVQLIPDATGGVKVLIGLKSYALDEVPDEEIRRLIRESVAEWEASQ